MTLKDLRDAFLAVPLTVVTSYMDELDDVKDARIKQLIEADPSKTARVLAASSDVPYFVSEFNFSEGEIRHMGAFMWTFGLKPRDTVENAEAWLKTIYINSCGNTSQPDSVKEFNGLRLWRYSPVGGVRRTAQRWGDSGLYAVLQPVEIAGEKI